MKSKLDIMSIRDMNFYGYHGVFPEEERLGQRFVVHLEAYLDITQAALTDDVTKTVNYASVYQYIRAIVETERYQLIETLADRIAIALLKEFLLLEGVSVEVVKLHAPIPQFNGSVSIQIKRMRYYD